MAVDFISTGVAAAALTAVSRIFEAVIRRSVSRKTGSDPAPDSDRMYHLEGALQEMKAQMQYVDADYRLTQLETHANRHGWNIPMRGKAATP